MKKLYFLAAFVLLSFGAFGQIVNIPDANFKNALLHTICASTISDSADRNVDTNNDGEIQISEALTVGFLEVDSQNISSLDGLSAFSNLQIFSCANNNLNALDLGGLNALMILACPHNALTSLDLSNKDILGLNCSYNLLTNIIWNPNNNPPDALSADLSYNLFTTLDLPLNITEVNDLDLSGNPFTTLTIPAISVHDFEIRCENMPNLISLESHVGYLYHGCYIRIKNDPILQYINFRNNVKEFGLLNEDPESVNWWHTSNPIENCPALQAICVDDFELPEAYFYFGSSNVNLTSYCSFTPASPYNTVSGFIKFDF